MIENNVKNAIKIGSICSVSYLAVYIARNLLAVVSPEMIDVLNYRVINRTENGRVPSDHYPIIMEYNITNEKSGKE